MDHPNQGGDQDEQLRALIAQHGGISFDEFASWCPDIFTDVPGTEQDRAPTGPWGELDSSHFHNPQAFGNQSVAGTEQPAPGAPEFAYNENQTLSSHAMELKKQQCDQLLVGMLETLQRPMMPLGPCDASYSIDQFSPLPAFRTQLPEYQMPAGIEPLIQEQLDPAAEKEQKRERKRAADRAYRLREKNKKQELEDKNQELLKALQAQMKHQLQKQELQDKCTKAEAEKEEWKKQWLLLNEKCEKISRKKNQLHQEMKAMRKQLKNLGKLCIKKPKKKLKKQVMMVETAEETKNDN